MRFAVVRYLLAVILLLAGFIPLFAQSEKVIDNNAHFWTSVNNVYRFTNKWGMVSDFHIRRTEFLRDPSFYFMRFGVRYWIQQKMNMSGGYAHLWLAPRQEGWTTFADENRIYQEIQMVGLFYNSSVLFRIRNEQRWRERIVDNQSTGDYLFSNRFRMLISTSIPLGQSERPIRLMIANEIHFSLGQSIVFNTFDQNRFTIGINKKISRDWRFDLGYMIVYQQRPSGFEYDLNHTFRIFFYGLFDFRKKTPKDEIQIIPHAEE